MLVHWYQEPHWVHTDLVSAPAWDVPEYRHCSVEPSHTRCLLGYFFIFSCIQVLGIGKFPQQSLRWMSPQAAQGPTFPPAHLRQLFREQDSTPVAPWLGQTALALLLLQQWQVFNAQRQTDTWFLMWAGGTHNKSCNKSAYFLQVWLDTALFNSAPCKQALKMPFSCDGDTRQALEHF